MFRRLLPFILIFLAILLDATVLPVLVGDVWFLPPLTLASGIALGLLLGRTRGVLYSLIAGLLIDILTATPLGIMTMLYAAAGYLAGYVIRQWPRSPLSPPLGALALLSAYELFLIAYLFLASSQFSVSMLWRAGVRVAAGTALIVALRYVFDRMIKPSHSRYAAL